MKHLTKKIQVSLEEIADGVSRKEKELEWYAKVDNLNEIISMSVGFEDQEQYGVPSIVNGKMLGSVRCRKTISKEGTTSYVQTIKVKTQTDRDEAGLPVTKDIFEMFKALSDQGLIKRRYFIPVKTTDNQSLVFEVDTFQNTQSDECWVKIDLEIQDNPDISIPNIPFSCLELIPGNTQLEDERAKIGYLYNNVFTVKK